MIYASCRKDFTSTTFHAPLAFRDEKGADLSLQQVLDECAGQDVDILVHGYRNTFDAAAKAYRYVDEALDAGGIHGRRIGFFWCGSWARIGFLAAVMRTKKASAELAYLLMLLNERGCRVTVETHSLGARVALQALMLGVRIERLVLTAPAVNRDVFCEGKEFVAAAGKARRVAVLWSSRDSVLKWAYRLASRFATALGLAGPKGPYPHNVVERDMSSEVGDHGGYKTAPTTYLRCWWRH